MNHILSLCIKYKCKKTSPQNFFRLKNFFFFIKLNKSYFFYKMKQSFKQILK